jgi:hypothetical protein
LAPPEFEYRKGKFCVFTEMVFYETGLLHQRKTRWHHYFYLGVGKCQLMPMRVFLFELELNIQIFNRFNGPNYFMLPEAKPTSHSLACGNYTVEATLVTRGSNSDS